MLVFRPRSKCLMTGAILSRTPKITDDPDNAAPSWSGAPPRKEISPSISFRSTEDDRSEGILTRYCLAGRSGWLRAPRSPSRMCAGSARYRRDLISHRYNDVVDHGSRDEPIEGVPIAGPGEQPARTKSKRGEPYGAGSYHAHAE